MLAVKEGRYAARNGKVFDVVLNAKPPKGKTLEQYPFKLMLTEEYGWGVTESGKIFGHNSWDDPYDLVREADGEELSPLEGSMLAFQLTVKALQEAQRRWDMEEKQ